MLPLSDPLKTSQTALAAVLNLKNSQGLAGVA
jgi:hypothetical protein